MKNKTAMKNHHTAESRESRAEGKTNLAPIFSCSRPSTLDPRLAFTLIELLVVISIIAVLAAFTIPVLGGIKRHEYINKTQAEMAQLETAIESYKSAYGFYPPGNPNYSSDSSQAMFSPLYFELLGTTNNNGTYYTLDDSASISTNYIIGFGVSGFINCNKPDAGEDARPAKNFLPDLKPSQIGQNVTNKFPTPHIPVTLLLGSSGGPDINYTPLGAQNVNPWRYVSPGINNPNGYDLWMQLVIKPGQTNLVCNWSKQVQINSPLP
ncbi:MAG TPA: type II secretion system protein [Verrucomicrobiae bacterium]